MNVRHVSVVVVTWNRCALLAQTLEGLTRLVVPDGVTWDLLVVDNNCNDETAAVIERYAGRLPVRRLFETAPGAAAARNAALDVVTGDYVLFTDDDVLVDPSWLAEFVAAARAYPEAAAIGGIIEPWFPTPPDPDLCAAFPRLRTGFCGLDYERPSGLLPDALPLWGANMGCRRAAIDGIRFDTTFGPRPTSTMGGDDTDFVRRIRTSGGAVLWWPRMHVRHYVQPSRMTLEYLLRHQRGDGTATVLGAPPEAAGRLGGVPRWLLRRRVEVVARYLLAHLTGGVQWPVIPLLSGPAPAPDAGRRVRVLTWRREFAFLSGMIDGARQRDGHG